MSEHTEARTVAFFPIYDPATGTKINFTIRGGTTLAEVGEDLAVIRDAIASMGTMGLSLTTAVMKADGTVVSGEYDETRDSLYWVRGLSKNGVPVLWAYADHPKMETKNVIAYSDHIVQLPITQAEWDAAPIWSQGGTAPTKDAAIQGGYLQTFPHEIKWGMFDTGETFNNHKIMKPKDVLNAAPGGVHIEGANPTPAPAAAPVANMNTTGAMCPACHAPAGKPHGTGCTAAAAPVATPTPAPAATLPTAVNVPPVAQRGFPETPKNVVSPRQTFTAQLKMLGEALYLDWNETRAQIVTNLGVASGSAADLTDEQLSGVVNQLKDAAIKATLDFAGNAGWDESTAKSKLNDLGYKQLGNWNGDLGTLPVQFVVKLFEAATADAANA